MSVDKPIPATQSRTDTDVVFDPSTYVEGVRSTL